MQLGALLSQAGIGGGPYPELEITGVTHDSRQAAPGSLFVAVKGFHADGHDHVADAAARGAAAAVVEHEVPGAPIPQIPVSAPREALADLSCAFFQSPTQALTLVGITGTNGKTTTAYLVESMLAAAGHVEALLGTVETRIGGTRLETGDGITQRTTGEAPDLQALFAHMVREGASAAVMEVSSHALALERVRGCHFDVGVFTNLTKDHLDFHGTMQEYFAQKKRLFEGLAPGAVVVNVDDTWGRRLADDLDRPITFGLGKGTREATLVPRDLIQDRDGTRFILRTARGELPVESSLVGEFNLYNLLAAAGVGLALGLSVEEIHQGIAAAHHVPGRLERIEAGQPFTVLVDYAHTPDALERLLSAVRPLAQSARPQPALRGRVAAARLPQPAPGRIITVMGCGGDRDPSKRAPMGKAAATGSDRVFITADNPRSEPVTAICKQVAAGARAAKGAPFEVIEDREQAIRKALGDAHPGDVVVIAGKGHETEQIIGDDCLPFDDRDVARRLITELV